jgi:CheY-like chemotaxis protein
VPHPPTILCIDDNVLTLAIRKAMLESRDCRVFTAENGPAGLEIANREQIEVVILDYNMPGMDGGAVAEEIRRKYPDMAILLLSGFPSKIPESLLSIVDGFIYKGSSPAILLQELQRVTTARRQRPERMSRTSDYSRKQLQQTRQLIAHSRQPIRPCRRQRKR